MRKFVLLVMMMAIAVGGFAMDKKALLVVSFGTSYKETRAKTIEAVEEKLVKEFEGYDFYRAFTSNIIIKVIKKKESKDIMTVAQALDMLKNKGYDEVLVQSTHIMNGAEYDDLKEIVQFYENKFSSIKLGKPLLTSAADYLETVKAVEKQLPELKDDEAVVFMGHGTHHHANSAYGTIEYAFHDMGNKNVFMGTVEGYPEIGNVINRLKENNIKKVTLMPFMLVAGDHASNDMAGDEEDSWKTILTKEGYEVNTYLHGLGENKGIQDIFVAHAKEALKGNESH